MDFKSNGKPGRIYHWNLPVLKKMFTKKNDNSRKASELRLSDEINDFIDIKKMPTWSNIWDGNKSIVRTNTEWTKTHKKKTPAYYAPAKQKMADTARYFTGNGKLKSFYIIRKNQYRPFHQELIA